MADLQVAKTIAQQLGNKALFMLGAKNLAGSENGLFFQIRGSKKFTHISIELNSMDTYDITFKKIRSFEVKDEVKKPGIYVEDMRRIIEENTGLYTNL